LVTGASSGLGAAFARELARRGHDLILVARREERLSALAAELTGRHGVGVAIWPADLAAPAALEQVARRIEALPALDLLVNNAGVGEAAPFAKADPAHHAAMVALHVGAPVRLTHAALPAMLARGRGGVINVSSLAAFIALPGSVTYCATKAALVSFSRALDLETRPQGVRVQALCPGFMRTELHDPLDRARFDPARVPSFMWSSPEAVAQASLAGLEKGQAICVPGMQYRAIYLLARIGLIDWIMPFAARRRLR
jgi:hypothetical protein